MSRTRSVLSVLAWPVVVVANAVCVGLAVHAGYAPGLVLVVAAAACLAASTALELLLPFRPDWGPRHGDTGLDVQHLLWTEIATQVLFRVLLGGVAAATGFVLGAPRGGGAWRALGLGHLPWALQLAAGALLYDLMLYWQHRLMHEVPWLWRFHRVHHTAERMASLAGIRNHALSPFVTACISTVFAATGVPATVFFVCQSFVMAKGWLQHSNADLATGPLDHLFMTPRMHRWHHSTVPGEEQTNFGLLTNVWDRVPWHRLPGIGPRLRIQRVTFFRAPAEGPAAVGGIAIPGATAFARWRGQTLAPLPSFDDVLRYAGYPVILAGTMGLYAALLAAGLPKWPVFLGHIALTFGLLKAIERRIPYRADWKTDGLEEGIDGWHFALSTALSHVAQVASGLLVVRLLGPAAVWVPFAGIWGRLGLDHLPVWAQFPLALVVMDLGMYWHHRLMHEIPAMWRIHEVHHLAETFSPLRSVRNHPIGPFLTSVLMASLLVAGIPVHVYLLCQGMLVSVGLFQHVNADLRLGVLDQVFIGPRAHRWHHSDVPFEGNHNFGILTTLGDRIPWHRLPLLGALVRFHRTTLLLPAAGSPRRIGLQPGGPRVRHDRSVLWNYAFQLAWPLRAWAHDLRTALAAPRRYPLAPSVASPKPGSGSVSWKRS